MIRIRRTSLLLLVLGGAIAVAALAGSPRSEPTPDITLAPNATQHAASSTQPTSVAATRAATATQPGSTRPTTSPATARPEPATPFPVRFGTLLTRSIFVRGQQSAEAILAAQKMTSGGKEAGIVFRGVGLTDGQITAYLEDVASKKFLRQHQGDAIAGGRIAGITLNELQFELGGQTKVIVLGQNLAGAVVAAPPPPAATQPATSPGGAPPGGPNRPGGPRPPGGGNPQQQQPMQMQSEALQVDG